MGLLGLVAAVGSFCIPSSAWAADVATASGKLLVLPFNAMNQNEYQPWLGRSIQQSLVADLLAAAPGRVLSSETPAADDAAALDVGRKLGAQYVVRGDFASVGGDVRITGQVLDVTSGKPVTAIKATGPSSNVFAMEDDLTAQVRRRLSLTARSSGAVARVDTTVPPMQALQAPPQPPVDPYAQTYVAPTQSNPPAQIEYNYYYADPTPDYFPAPALGWLWPSCGYGVTYVLPGDFHHYHHNWNHFSTASNNRWNGSLAYGTPNSVNGVPIGTGVNTLHGSGGMYNIAGSTRGAGVGTARVSGGAVHSTSTHVATTHAPTFHMSTGFGFHAGTSMHR